MRGHNLLINPAALGMAQAFLTPQDLRIYLWMLENCNGCKEYTNTRCFGTKEIKLKKGQIAVNGTAIGKKLGKSRWSGNRLLQHFEKIGLVRCYPVRRKPGTKGYTVVSMLAVTGSFAPHTAPHQTIDKKQDKPTTRQVLAPHPAPLSLVTTRVSKEEELCTMQSSCIARDVTSRLPHSWKNKSFEQILDEDEKAKEDAEFKTFLEDLEQQFGKVAEDAVMEDSFF